jgi:hypothetical protein
MMLSCDAIPICPINVDDRSGTPRLVDEALVICYRSAKDGVSVAKEIELKDRFENMGAQVVKQVASKTANADEAIGKIIARQEDLEHS